MEWSIIFLLYRFSLCVRSGNRAHIECFDNPDLRGRELVQHELFLLSLPVSHAVYLRSNYSTMKSTLFFPLKIHQNYTTHVLNVIFSLFYVTEYLETKGGFI
jgi:hypothetical protein